MNIYPVQFKLSTKPPFMYACNKIATIDKDGIRIDILKSVTGKTVKSVLDKASLEIIKYRLNHDLPV